MKLTQLLFASILILIAGCNPAGIRQGYFEKGLASWYGPRFHGRKTASGERFNMNAMTAAHKTLPLGTWVRVKSLTNGKEVVVRINDRGPFVEGRIIDLSRAAARKLGMIQKGNDEVELSVPTTPLAAKPVRSLQARK
ncbi:MAG TPA: septal ring lytic transglycosylase RlpA family protein [Bdellovibrionales bacterium]|nr:septal ring lytic transglycosylase RlpA family protein [Bdellovibrionales bacterium]